MGNFHAVVEGVLGHCADFLFSFFFSGDILNLPWGGGEEVGNNLLKYISAAFCSVRHGKAS